MLQTLLRLVYEKFCHLLVELEHMAYWEINALNLDYKATGDRDSYNWVS